MAIRETIAKRLSTVKSRGVKLPIINEIALPAKIISMRTFNLTESRIERERLIPSVGPTLVKGKAVGDEAGRWYRVVYSRPIEDAIPVVVGEARGGEITKRLIEKVGDVGFKEIEYHNKTLTEYIDEIFAALPDWLEPIAAPLWGNWRNAFAQAGGRILYIIQQLVLNPRTDSIRDQLNLNIKEFNDKISAQMDIITDAVNARLNDLYNMWGVPSNSALTPLHLRNVDDTGFEFQSYGNTTAYFIVLGGS